MVIYNLFKEFNNDSWFKYSLIFVGIVDYFETFITIYWYIKKEIVNDYIFKTYTTLNKIKFGTLLLIIAIQLKYYIR